MRRPTLCQFVVFILAFTASAVLLHQLLGCYERETEFWRLEHDEVSGGDLPSVSFQMATQQNGTVLRRYTRTHPLVFVGGVPRSGTTLVRALLDAHPDIRCGVETRVVPRILELYQRWKDRGPESVRLKEAGLLGEPLDAAVTAFILQIIARNGRPATRLCSKDPYALSYASALGELFPRARFVLVVRDGRAVLASLLRNKVRISGFDRAKPLDCLQQWSEQMRRMWLACAELGTRRCLVVRYEHLVHQPSQSTHRLLRFLHLSDDSRIVDNMLLFWKRVGSTAKDGIPVSNREKSSWQIRRAVHSESVAVWQKELPDFVINSAAQVAPMLRVLGYL